MNEIRLKFLVSKKITTGASESASDYNPDETRYIRISDFDENGKIRESSRVSIPNEKANNYLLKKNDVLIAVTGATVGKSMVFSLSEKAAYAGYLARIRTNEKLNYKYLYYFLNSPLFDKWRKESINVSTIENISAGKYANLPIYYHNVETQNKIVEKLNFKVEKIDKLIDNQQQQIEKLKEYKQSQINFYMDKYIYDLQEHKGRINRDAIPLNYIANIIRGNTPFKKDELLDKGVYVGVQYGKTYKTEIIDENYNFFVDSKFFKEDQIVNNGDVIFISTSETIEDLGHASFYNRNELGLLGGEQFVFKPNKEKTNGKFLYYCAVEFSKYIKKYSTGLKVYRYNLTHLKNIHINLPSIDIQESIVKQLDKNILAINSILGIKQKKIDKLNEYKKSLIYEYVTGKKEVA